MVPVEVLFEGRGAVDEGALQRLGATRLRRRDRRVQALMPVSALRRAALLDPVAQVRMPPKPIPLQGFPPTVSEGVQLTSAMSLQVGGITGMGVSVAVIDSDFLGYTAGELPLTVNAVSFRSDGLIDVGTTGHGVACAETIMDMAPDVDLHLLAVQTVSDIETALEWADSNDIDIVNISMGVFEGPFDGTHSLDKVVDRVRANGTMVVVSAGNHAQKHWAGDYLDADGDSLCEFGPADEGIGITVTDPTQPITAHLSWFQTAGPTGQKAEVTNRDYDILLLDSTSQVIARSAVTQNGNDPPTELLVAFPPAAGAYEIQVLAVSSNIPTGPTDALIIFMGLLDIDPVNQVVEESLLTPGTAAGALTVAATRGNASLGIAGIIDYAVDTLEDFSSHGPTVDGRMKPDIAAPNFTVTSIATQSPFSGTSAAAPHVAGGAALLKSEDATRTADELETVLLRLATDQNVFSPIPKTDSTLADPDEAGVGRLTLRSGLDTKPPSISITFPVNSTTITTARPTVVGVVTDSETGVDVATISLSVDGTAVGYDSYNPGSGVVTYTPPSDLTRAAHTVTLSASDNAGNVGTPAVTNFRVGLPTLSAGLHMISLPFRNLVNANPASIFGLTPGEVAMVRWLATDAAFSKYRIYPDPMAGFEPPDALGANPTVVSPPAGLGYFVNLPRQVIINVAGETLADVASYTIRLPLGSVDPTGWHMIGNPYQDTIDWATVQFETNGVRQDLDDAIDAGVTEGIIFEYVPAAGARPGHYEFVQALAAVLDPMKGYWLHVNQSTEVIIYPATVATSAAAKKAASLQAEPTTDDWQLQLVAEARGMLDTANYLGVAPGASTSYDCGADIPEPPALGDSLALYFPHPDWDGAHRRCAQDMRAGGAMTEEWEFDVVCPAKNADVALSWPALNAQVPADVTLHLVDMDTGRTWYMRTLSSVTYNSGDGGTRHLKIVAQTGIGAGLQITSLSAAPVHGGLFAVSYELTTAANITAEVRNLAGRPVAMVVSGRDVGPGLQTLTWDGKSSQGLSVPNGVYLLHLTARTPDGQAAMRVCPMTAVR